MGWLEVRPQSLEAVMTSCDQGDASVIQFIAIRSLQRAVDPCCPRLALCEKISQIPRE